MRKPPTLEQIKEELESRIRQARFDMTEAHRKGGDDDQGFLWSNSRYEALVSFMHYIDPSYEEE